jgi:hypothetical protein
MHEFVYPARYGESVLVDHQRRDAAAALVTLCGLASERSRVDTSDSWIHYHPDQAEAIQNLLSRDPVISENLQPGKSFCLAGTNWGVGTTPFRQWLQGFVRAALAGEPDHWQAEAERFIAFFAVDTGTLPCLIRTTLLGVFLNTGQVVRLHNGRIRPATFADFSRQDSQHEPPPAVVFEYEDDLPAVVASQPWARDDDVVEATTNKHEEAVTRLLLAFALATTGPVQIDLTMRELRYSSGAGGRPPEDPGPVVIQYPTVLDARNIGGLQAEYQRVAGQTVRGVAVATRRYLRARSERVRPADEVIDYAIAIESMTTERGGKKQGKELGRLLGDTPSSRKRVEDDHIKFRLARERIVHEGETPANVKEAAAIGEDLVRRSLQVRTGT